MLRRQRVTLPAVTPITLSAMSWSWSCLRRTARIILVVVVLVLVVVHIWAADLAPWTSSRVQRRAALASEPSLGRIEADRAAARACAGVRGTTRAIKHLGGEDELPIDAPISSSPGPVDCRRLARPLPRSLP